MSIPRKILSAVISTALVLEPLAVNADSFYFRNVAPLPGYAPSVPSDNVPEKAPDSVKGTGDLSIFSPVQLRARIGVAFSLQFSAQGALGATRWNSVGTALPAGLTLSDGGLLSGTPAAAASAAGVVVEAVDAEGKRGRTQPITLDVKPTPTVTVAATTSAVAGADVAVRPTAKDVYGSRSWSLTGTLPVGMSVDPATGAVTGAPEQAGLFDGLVLTVVDADGARGNSAPFSIAVASNIAINGLKGAYQARLGKPFTLIRPYATGTPGPYAWSLSSAGSALPSGLTLNASSGAVSGTPDAIGTSATVVLRAQDSGTGERVSSAPFSLRVGGQPSVTLGAAYYGRVGRPLVIAPEAGDVLGRGYWSVAGGLPSGLALDTATGRITGAMPGQTTANGITLKVTDLFDGASATSGAFSIQAWPDLTVGYAYAPAAKVGTDFVMRPPTVAGLRGSIGWSLAGTLPDGLAIDPSTGEIHGTPSRSGTFGNLYYMATDSADKLSAYSPAFSISVAPLSAPTSFAVAPLASEFPATVGRSFSLAPVATGASGAVTWSLRGTRPDWLSFDPSTGVLQGNPTSADTFSGLSLVASDAGTGRTASSTGFSVVVSPSAPLSIAAARIARATATVPYTSPGPSVLNARGTVRFSLARGALPTGLDIVDTSGALSGTPAVAGDYPGLSIAAADATGATATSPSFTLGVNASPDADGRQSPSAGMPSGIAALGVPFGIAPTATDVTSPLSWTLASGALPAWLSLDPATGALSGTPDVLGDVDGLVLLVTDSTGRMARTNAFSVSTVATPSLAASMPQVLYGTLGQGFVSAPTVGGIQGAQTWVASKALPAGLSLNAGNGVITGVPTQAGTVAGLTLKVTDASGASATTNAFAVSVLQPGAVQGLTATLPSLMGGIAGVAFSVYPSVSGASGETSWTLSAGTLPPGLALDGATGRIHGTPTQSTTASDLALTVRDATGAAAATNPFSIGIQPASAGTPAALSASFPDPLSGTEGAALTAYAIASNASGQTLWSLSGGSLPNGLSLDAATGRVSGTPTTATTVSGLVLTVTDAKGAQASTTPFSVSVAAATPGLGTNSPPSASIASTLSATINATFRARPTTAGTVGATVWSVRSGTLPAGLGLDSTSGEIAGTPAIAGTTTGLRLSVTDSTGAVALTQTFSIVVSQPAMTLAGYPSTLATNYGSQFSVTAPSVSGASGAVSWKVSYGTLPSWASLDAATGALTGRSNALGSTAGLKLTATDGTGVSATTGLFSISVVRPDLAVSGPTGRVATHANVALAIPAPTLSGAIGSVAWSFAGTLPPGLALNPDTGAVSGTPTANGGYDALVLTARDSFDGRTASSAPFAIDVVGAPSIFASSAYPASRGHAFVARPTATDTVGKVTWSLASGTLPAWASLDGTTGAISGTPTETRDIDGLSLSLSDSTGATARSATFSIKVSPSLSVATSRSAYRARVSLPFASGASQATNPAGAVTWSLGSGALPSWATVDPTTGEIRGTPDAPSSTLLTLRAKDAEGTQSDTASFALVTLPLPTVTSPTASVRVNAPLSATPGVADAVGAQVWTLARGTLPDWARIDASTGTVLGTPTALGNYPGLALLVTDSDGAAGTGAAFAINVTAGITAVGLDPQYAGRVGFPLATKAPTAGNALGTVTWSLLAGRLPNGVGMGTSGIIAGNPTESGTFPLVVQARDSRDGATVNAATSVFVERGLQVLASPAVTVHSSQPFGTQALPVVGQRGSLTWSVTSGALPNWATLSPDTGIVSGTAPADVTSVTGLRLTATDSVDGATATTDPFSIQVVAPLGIANLTTSYAGRFGFAFASTPPVLANKVGAVSWSWGGGTPPKWASVNPATGVISGLPDALGQTTGITLVGRDATGSSATSALFSITVYSQPAIEVASTTFRKRVGDQFTLVPTAKGLVGGATWSINALSGSMPTGIDIDPATGKVSGTISAPGTVVFSIRVEDGLDGVTADSSPISLTAAPALVVTGLQDAYRYRTGTYVSTDMPSVTGQQGAVAFSIDSAVPDNSTFDVQGGTISGLPNLSFPERIVTLTARDAFDQKTSSATFRLAVNLPLAVSGTRDVTVRNGTPASTATFTPTVSNLFFSGNVQWAVTSGELPSGVSLDMTNGRLTGTPTGYASVRTFPGIVITATDATDKATASSSPFSVTVNPTFSATLAQSDIYGRIGTPFKTAEPVVSGAVGAPTWSVVTTVGTKPADASPTAKGAVTFTPSQAGVWAFRIRATDPNDNATADTGTVTVTSVPTTQVAYKASIAPATSASVSLAPTVNYNLGALRYELATGTFPTGLGVDPATGLISGSTTQKGTFYVTIKATDIDGAASLSNQVRIAVSDGPDVFLVNAPAKVGRPIGIVAQVANSTSYTFTQSGTLPPGLTFSSSTGTLSGTPTTIGTYPNITVTVTDTARSISATSDPITIAVAAGNQLVQPSALTWRQGQSSQGSLSTTNAVGDVAYAVASGSLPNGITLSTTGAISGRPTVSGSYSVSVRSVDSEGSVATGTTSFAIAVGPSVSYAGRSFYPSDTVSLPPTVAGVTGTATFSVESGSLPAGVALSPTTGTISGKAPDSGSTSLVSVRVTDSDGAYTVSQPFTFAVSVNGFVVDVATAASGQVSQPFSLQATALLHDLALQQYVSWYLTDRLPAGVTFDALSGRISGTPTEKGTFTLRFNAKYNGQSAVSALVTLTIADRPALVATATGVGGRLNAPFSLTPTTTGNVGNVSWLLATGALPSGTSLNPSTGVVSGTATASGSYTFTLKATDSSSTAVTPSVTGTISDAVTASVTVISSTNRTGQPYVANASVTGGAIGSVRWSVASGVLPNGVALNANNGAVSGTPTAAGFFSSRLRATDSTGAYGEVALVATVTPAPSVATVQDFALDKSGALSFTPTASNLVGAAANIKWSLSGTVPAWLKVTNVAQGTISGTPGTSGSWGDLRLVVTDTDGLTATSNPFTVVATAATVLTATIPADISLTRGTTSTVIPALSGNNGSVRYEFEWYYSGAWRPASYFWANSATTDSTSTYTLANLSSAFAGLSFSNATGTISGTPFYTSAWGPYAVRVHAYETRNGGANAVSNQADARLANWSLPGVTGPTTISGGRYVAIQAVTPTPSGTLTGSTLRYDLDYWNGTGWAALAIPAGSIYPMANYHGGMAGLSFDSRNGQLSGTPTVAQAGLRIRFHLYETRGSYGVAEGTSNAVSYSISDYVAGTVTIPATLAMTRGVAATAIAATPSGMSGSVRYEFEWYYNGAWRPASYFWANSATTDSTSTYTLANVSSTFAGLSFSNATGTISGTPSYTSAWGPYAVRVHAYETRNATVLDAVSNQVDARLADWPMPAVSSDQSIIGQRYKAIDTRPTVSGVLASSTLRYDVDYWNGTAWAALAIPAGAVYAMANYHGGMAGLSFDSRNGQISGAPTVAQAGLRVRFHLYETRGSYGVVEAVSPSVSYVISDYVAGTVTIPPTLAMTRGVAATAIAAIPSGMSGSVRYEFEWYYNGAWRPASYFWANSATTDSTSTYTLANVSAAFAGLSFSNATGTISGTPSYTSAWGPYAVRVHAYETRNGTVLDAVSNQVDARLADWTTPTVSAPTVISGTRYAAITSVTPTPSGTLTGSTLRYDLDYWNGTGWAALAIPAGSIYPMSSYHGGMAGLSFDSRNGQLSGTPTVAQAGLRIRFHLYETRGSLGVAEGISNAVSYAVGEYVAGTVTIPPSLAMTRGLAATAIAPTLSGMSGSVRYEFEWYYSGAWRPASYFWANSATTDSTSTYTLANLSSAFAGLSFSNATGTISGTPFYTSAWGPYAVRVHAYETRNGTVLDAVSNQVDARLADWTTPTVSAPTVISGTRYAAITSVTPVPSGTLTGSTLRYDVDYWNGTAWAALSIPAGSIYPMSNYHGGMAGLSFDSRNGQLSGAPTVAQAGLRIRFHLYETRGSYGVAEGISNAVSYSITDYVAGTVTIPNSLQMVKGTFASIAATPFGMSGSVRYEFEWFYSGVWRPASYFWANSATTDSTSTYTLANISSTFAGLSFSNATGTISGTPSFTSAWGPYAVRVHAYETRNGTALDAVSNQVDMRLAMTATSGVKVSYSSLAARIRDTSSVQAQVSGGSPTSYKLYYRTAGTAAAASNETLPANAAAIPWLTIDASTGALTAAPPVGTALGLWRGMQACLDGSTTSCSGEILVQVSDRLYPTLSMGSVAGVVNGTFSATPTLGGNVQGSVAYSFTTGNNVTANAAGTGDIVIATNAAIPTWMKLDPATGAFTGSPPLNSQGRYRGLKVCVADADAYKACSDEVVVTVSDRSPMTLALASATLAARLNDTTATAKPTLAGNVVGTPVYSMTYRAYGTAAAASNETLPASASAIPWLTLDTATGVLTASPPVGTVQGTWRGMRLCVADSQTTVCSQEISVKVADRLPFAVAVPSPSGVVNGTFSTTAVPSGNVVGTLTYTLVTGVNVSANAASTGDIVVATSAAIPSWMGLNATTGVLAGNPPLNSQGRYRGMKICATDSQSYQACSDEVVVTIADRDPFTMSLPFTLVSARINDAFAGPVPVVGGNVVGKATFSLSYRANGTPAAASNETLPANAAGIAWLNIDPSTGATSGTPPVGTTQNMWRGMKVCMADSQRTLCSDELRIQVADRAGLTLDAPAFPEAAVTRDFKVIPTIGGNVVGTPTYSLVYGYNVSANAASTDEIILATSTSKPAWLNFDTASGTLSGNPPVNAKGRYRGLQVCATDTQSYKACSGEVVLVVRDRAPLSVTTPAQIQARINDLASSAGLTLVGATGPATYSLTYRTAATVAAASNETLPANAAAIPWLAIDTATGALTASPPAGTTFGLWRGMQISVTDGERTATSGEVTILVADRGLPTIVADLTPTVTVGQAISTPATVGGTTVGGVSFSLGYGTNVTASAAGTDDILITAAGSMPAWLSMTTSGVIVGTPPAGAKGRYRGLRICAKDGQNYQACTAEIVITVLDRPTLTASVPGSFEAKVGTAFSGAAPTVSNPARTPSYTLAYRQYGTVAAATASESFPSSSTSPSWIAFDPTTGIVSGTPPAGSGGTQFRGMSICANDGQQTACTNEVVIRVSP